MTATVAVAALETRARVELARYLEEAGFEVSQFDQPPKALGLWSLVWLAERDLQAQVAETVVASWLRRGHERRVVIVSWRPATLRPLLDRYEGRLFVFPPPVFGWQVVDALRAGDRGPEA